RLYAPLLSLRPHTHTRIHTHTHTLTHTHHPTPPKHHQQQTHPPHHTHTHTHTHTRIHTHTLTHTNKIHASVSNERMTYIKPRSAATVVHFKERSCYIAIKKTFRLCKKRWVSMAYPIPIL